MTCWAARKKRQRSASVVCWVACLAGYWVAISRIKGISKSVLQEGVTMSLSLPGDEQLRHDAEIRAFIDQELRARFAPEDEALLSSIARAQAENVPAIQISPLQGKLLQVLALACGARTILEIGALAGYSGVWLARSLPPDGKLISLEVNPRHAEIARATFATAGLSHLSEVRVGSALD